MQVSGAGSPEREGDEGAAARSPPARSRVSGGNATVKLRFTKAAKRSLKRAQRVKVRIKVAFTPTGGATQRQTVSLTLTR